MVFKASTGLQKPTDMIFDEMPSWVQCHNLPLAFMKKDILQNLDSRVGKVLKVDEGEGGSCTGRFARIRVMLDNNKPIKQGLLVQSEKSQEKICVILLYERLPNFCFKVER